jgi:hypothetical protein
MTSPVFVSLEPSSNASARTKARLREHPGAFLLKRTVPSPLFGGRECHDLHHPDGWFGWIPADEVLVRVRSTFIVD